MKPVQNRLSVYIPALVLLLGIGMFSCEKCRNCRYVDNNEVYASPEFCGSKEEVEDFKEEWQKRADSAGAELECY